MRIALRLVLAGVVVGSGIALVVLLVPGAVNAPHRPVSAPVNATQTAPDVDVPCTEDDSGGLACPTPLAEPRRELLAAARALEVAALDIVPDHLGSYEIPVGTAILAGGFVRDQRLELANGDQGTYAAPRFWLELRDPVSKRAIPANAYERGLTDRLLEVEVVLRFELERFDPGAVIEVRNIVVGS